MNKELIKLKADYGLTAKQIAKLLGAKERTVYSWLTNSDNLRNMPAHRLDYLKYKLRNKKRVN